jgi:tRNA nucleotidyltransferase (CCA-adding enzyme)
VDTTALDQKLPQDVLGICQRLREAGFRGWLVGGSVRDALLGLSSDASVESKAPSDWDVATDARPKDMQKLFSRVVPTGIEHGTVTVLFGKRAYEVTTLRGETSYSNGRHPDSVHFVSDIVEDLARRDFTINAIAYDPLERRLIDPFDGTKDLALRRLRAVGDPVERFREDGLRPLRAARFVATLNVDLDPDTARAIQPTLDTYRKVSPERIRDEWLKAMTAQQSSRAFEVMKDHGLLGVTAPELLESVGCEQNRFHAYDVWGHTMRCMDGCPPDPILRLGGLLHDVGKPRSRQYSSQTRFGDGVSDYTFYEHERIGAEMADPLLARLRFSTEDRERIVQLVRHHIICYDTGWSDAAVRRWIRRVSPELIHDLYQLVRADVLAKGFDPKQDLERLSLLQAHVEKVMSEGALLSVRDLGINGDDLKTELGLAPGPIVGSILRALLELVIESPELNQRAALLERARELAEALKHGKEG